MNKVYIYSIRRDTTYAHYDAFALAEDGCVLGMHICSNEDFVKSDLGMDEGIRDDCKQIYAEYYPDGYEFEFVPASEVPGHAGLQMALALNKKLKWREKHHD